jgi:hypothetical protein
MQLNIGVDIGWLLNGCFCSIHLEFKYRSLDRSTEYSWRCSYVLIFVSYWIHNLSLNCDLFM